MSITPATLATLQQTGEAIDLARRVLANAVTEHAQRVMSSVSSRPTSADHDVLLDHWKVLARLGREVEAMEAQFKGVYLAAQELVLPEVPVLEALGHSPSVSGAEVPSSTPSFTSSSLAAAVKGGDIEDVQAKVPVKRARKSPVQRTVTPGKKAKPKGALAKGGKVAMAKAASGVDGPDGSAVVTAGEAAPALAGKGRGKAAGKKSGQPSKVKQPGKLSPNDAKVLAFLTTALNRKSWTKLTQGAMASGAGIPLGSIAVALRRLMEAGKVAEGDKGSYKLV